MPLSTINNKSIADGTIVATDILDGTISSSKLVASNIAGDRLAANTLSNTVFQTGSVESYLRGANLDFGMRNRIINGAMVIDQRNAGASVTPTDNQYTLDRWYFSVSQTSKLTSQQNAGSVTPPVGFINYLGVTSSSSYSVTSSDYFGFRQSIEGLNVADLAWGTASARPVTLSFWVRSSLTGSFGGSLFNSAANRSYPFSYTISTANTWEQKSVTVDGDTTGTWLTTNGNGIQVYFSLGGGTSRSGTANAWTGGTWASQPTGSTSVVGTNAATFYITGVQLEEGSQATPFEYRQHGTELALCQRYYEKAYDQDTSVPFAAFAWFTPTFGQSITNNTLHSIIKYSVSKRARPTILVYPFTTPANTMRVSNAAGGADFGANSGATYIVRMNQFALYNTSGGTLSVSSPDYGLIFGWSADAEL